MMKRKVLASIALILLFLMFISACSVKDTSSVTETSKEAGKGTTAETSAAPKEPDKIRFFYVTSGATIPEDFDLTKNPYLTKIAEAANVIITETIVPPWSDVDTKYNLMMSSGNICDVVNYTKPNFVYNDGMNGAYIDLTDFIKTSPVLSKLYAPYMEQLIAADGKIYCTRSLPVDGDVNNTFFTRWDVLQDLGYTKIPNTMDDWIEAMRKLKEKYPDSVPYTSMDNLHWCEFVFNSYGVSNYGYNWQIYFGKIIHNFENPLYKEAIKTYQLMLKEGLMDPEFVTNKRTDFDDKRYNRKVLVNQQNLAVCMTFAARFVNNGILEARPVPSQWPKIDDPRIDPQALYGGPSPVGNPCLSIASTSKVKDAGLRLIESFASPETKELAGWGIEGIDHNVVNGQKVSIIDSTSPKLMYNMIHGYNSKAVIENMFATGIERLKAAGADEQELNNYKELCWSQFDKIYADNVSVSIDVMRLITLEPDTASRRTEAESEALTIAVKAMRGDISLEEFDAQAAAFLKKYQFITDEYNQKLPEAKRKAG